MRRTIADAGEWLRFLVALAAFPVLLLDDLIYRHDEDEFIADQQRRFREMHVGE